MDLNEISVFIKVVQAGSFSKAAQQLNMPNSTVSSKVSSLEKRLGITLIQRTTRKLNITPAGEAYFKRCIQGIEEIQAAESEIAATQGEPQGLLRITAPGEFGTGVLPGLICDYTRKYPKVSVDILLTERRVDLLTENIDLAIRAGELKDSTLIAKKLGTVCFVAVASPKYLKSAGTPAHPKDLRDHQCLHFSQLADEWKFTNSKSTVSVKVNHRAMMNDLNMVKTLSLAGNGIAYLPAHVCYSDIQSNKLVRVLPGWHSTFTPIHFVYPAQKFVSPKLSAFIAMGTETIKKSFEGYLLDE